MTATAPLPAIEIETGPAPVASILWLHGLGADGGDFAPIVPQLGLAGAPPVRFIFPSAPWRRVTCNGGYPMRAWYDILALDPERRAIDEDSLLEARAAVRTLIAREAARSLPPHRILLAGFSQGGAVALFTALTHPTPLGGVLALSCYLPAAHRIEAGAAGCDPALPVLVAHGRDDDVVPPALGERAVSFLRARGLAPEWRTYPMPHAVCPAQIDDLGGWLRRWLMPHNDPLQDFR